ncbi:condensation domain-containing protein, partial [Actinoalloteichus spitiensis]
VEALVAHHDALRTVFDRTVDGGWRPRLLAELDIDTVLTVTNLQAGDADAHWEREVAGVQSGMDLSRGPLLRVLVGRTTGEPRLVLVAHHAVVDGVSWRIL